ncbi:HAMP domain-containing sensor histidine kinase [Bradyrhizobium sp. Tv2a-2]|uniref:sensor histidine kinase n=1 Tax=Bradyrhizobium sp. Tv2a-2 TaxID=113395 RepID=UPI000466CA6B|nr:HAMP domain-containing sensor histidine kinase [Bradyrhizobium sp. Tv2a-2]
MSLHGTRKPIGAVRGGSAATSTAVSPKTLTGCEFEATLLAMAGHDLRQPLQIIQNVRERLENGFRTASELTLLKLCQSAIDRLTCQLDQLLSALRISEHGGRIQLAPVNLESLLREARREHELAALEKGLQIRVVSTHSWISSDTLLLSAVLRNLVSNAIKYTEPGGRVLLGCRHFQNCVRLDVIDTGIGISDEHMSKIFEAFTRVEATRDGGLGIGLFIVRQAVAVLGHHVEVSSVAGRGTRFSIAARRVGSDVHMPQDYSA